MDRYNTRGSPYNDTIRQLNRWKSKTSDDIEKGSSVDLKDTRGTSCWANCGDTTGRSEGSERAAAHPAGIDRSFVSDSINFQIEHGLYSNSRPAKTIAAYVRSTQMRGTARLTVFKRIEFARQARLFVIKRFSQESRNPLWNCEIVMDRNVSACVENPCHYGWQRSVRMEQCFRDLNSQNDNFIICMVNSIRKYVDR